MIIVFRVALKCLFLFLTFSSSLSAQEKVEVERTVDASEVPNEAQEWVNDTYEAPDRMHWYLEESGNGRSYEAKFKYRGQWHSVEFGEDGTLQDIEIVVRGRELPATVRQPIQAYLDSTYTRHRIRKIQRQLSGEPDALRRAVRTASANGINERYEIEFYGKNAQEDALWEGLFDDQGQLLQRRKIVLRPTDNLIY